MVPRKRGCAAQDIGGEEAVLCLLQSFPDISNLVCTIDTILHDMNKRYDAGHSSLFLLSIQQFAGVLMSCHSGFSSMHVR